MAIQFLPMAKPGEGVSTLLDFSPVAGAINDVRKSSEAAQRQNDLVSIGQVALGKGYGAASKKALELGDVGTAMDLNKQSQMDRDRQIKLLGGVAQAAKYEKDPQRRALLWQTGLKRAGINPADLDPEELDPMTGPDAFIAAAGMAQDPRESQLMDLKIAGAQTDLAKARRPERPDIKEVDGRLVQVGPDGARVVYESPNAGNTKLKDALEKEQFKIDLKTVNEYRQGSDNASDVLGSLDELEAARAETGREGPMLGWLPNVTPSAQRVDSAAENVRLGFVQKTKGAVSDAEMRVFGNATPTMSMSDAAAQPIITGMRLANQRVQERSNFYDLWLRTRGSLQGAQEAWKRFTDENPILQRDPKTKQFVPRPENVGGWQKYFDGSATASPQRQQGKAPGRPPIDVGDGFSVEVQ